MVRAGLIYFCLLIVGGGTLLSGQVEGVVKDAGNGEVLVGATVAMNGGEWYDITGLDGSYRLKNVPSGEYKIEVSYVGFESQQAVIRVEGGVSRDFELETTSASTDVVVIKGARMRGTDADARAREKRAIQTLNILSQRSIELSPDITVANIVQRVSGLSVERNANGDPQYAIVRGMDKRYNYTLVNGVKIPSPDNKNRYIPLDIFPAQLLERLEVSKSLTPMMEGDAIGGVVNLVMKDAPETFKIEGDLQLGYNAINFDQGFNTYDRSDLNRQSPYEQYGPEYFAEQEDFSTSNMLLNNVTPLPDILGSVSLGDRFFDNKLGVMLGGSFQNSYRGNNSVWYRASVDNFGSMNPTLSRLQERMSSTQQQRWALHSKMDYRFNERHKLGLYLGNYQLNSFQSRDMLETFTEGRLFDIDGGDALLSYITRFISEYQNIRTGTLSGEHNFSPSWDVDWSAVVSLATNERPDDGFFKRNGEREDFVELPQNVERRNARRWESNSDRDMTLYVNSKYKPYFFGEGTALQFGGMFRDKQRESFFNRYIFDPVNPALQEEGIDWDDFSDVNLAVLNPRGNTSDPLNYDSYEQILAGYVNMSWNLWSTEFNAGVRAEHTNQGYRLKVASQFVNSDSAQVYLDFLPSLSLKHRINDRTNLRASYFVGLARPGFHEIVPYRIPEEDGFDEFGNPQLKRVISHNYDVRYEFFPKANEQLLLGAFLKDIRNPIEYVLTRAGGLTTGPLIFRPDNFGNALNWGLEMDFTRYYKYLGVRLNYTYTNSSITTSKIVRRREDPTDEASELVQRPEDQTRPLQGQANHVGNFSLLFKNMKMGTDAQLSFVYTGERIEFISPFKDNDHWSRPMMQLDFSIDQKVGKNFTIFLRVNNILDTPYELYIKRPLARQDAVFPYQDKAQEETLVRRDLYGRSFRLGARYQFK